MYYIFYNCKVYFTSQLPVTMPSHLLLPHRFKPFGWVILIFFLLLHILQLISESADQSNSFFLFMNRFLTQLEEFADEMMSVGMIIGLILTAFSKEKIEDERISRIRLESLLWSVYLNTALIVLAILFLYDFAFLDALVYNLFTTLLFFIVRFNLIMWLEKRKMKGSLT